MQIDTHINETIDNDIIDMVIANAITAWTGNALVRLVTKKQIWKRTVRGMRTVPWYCVNEICLRFIKVTRKYLPKVGCFFDWWLDT